MNSPKESKTRWKIQYFLLFISPIYHFESFNNLTQSFSFALLHNLKLRKLAFFYSSFAIKLVLANKKTGRKVAWIKPFGCRRSCSFSKKKGRKLLLLFWLWLPPLFKSHFMFDIKNFSLRSHVFQTMQDDIFNISWSKVFFRWLYWWTFFLQHFFYLLQSQKGQKHLSVEVAPKKGSKN